jgi:hypothetical protein
MDPGVAIVALNLRKMDLTVTLDTDQPDLTLGQEETIRRSMGNVTGVASLEFLGPVLKDEGTSFFGMAFEASIFFRELVDLPQVRVCPRSVGGVTIGAV